ncbi:MAG: PAS domain-containing protein [Cyclobacteriaceae bacterium]
MNYVESIPIPCCVTNDQGLFTNVNKACCQLYGYTKEDMMYRHFILVVNESWR